MQEEMKQIGEYQLIKSKRIIGMTSTGAARCNSLIQLLQTPIGKMTKTTQPIVTVEFVWTSDVQRFFFFYLNPTFQFTVIFEEAAEILESHIVAALTKSVQHLILIGMWLISIVWNWAWSIRVKYANCLYSAGDHQQLRPATSVYELARKFYMDISLFERMINNNMHCVTLNTQYRMRPEIANLIRPTIYKELLDDETVKAYPNVIGMAKNLYFIDHNEPESGVSDIFSDNYYYYRALSKVTKMLMCFFFAINSTRKRMKQQKRTYTNHSTLLLCVITLLCRGT